MRENESAVAKKVEDVYSIYDLTSCAAPKGREK
jgi:hypothetical protein